jgi:putative transposase
MPGAIYHVIGRGIERREIFKDDHDREEFIKRFSDGLQKTGSKCHGWVLMPNHFHLLIQRGKDTARKKHYLITYQRPLMLLLMPF